MRLDPPKTAGTSRPAPARRNTPSAIPPTTIKPQASTTPPSVGANRQTAGRALTPTKPKRLSAQQLLQPDAATKRLLELTVDPNTGQMTAGAGGGQVLLTMAKNLASRKGKSGTGSYLALASTGVPLAAMGTLAQKNAADYLKGLAVRGHDLTGIPKVSVLDPSERDAIRAQLKLKGVDPGPNASDAEILTATHKHKLSNIDILRNLPSSAGKAIVGLPVGAYAAGQAAGALAFKGDTKPLQQIGTGLADYYGAIANHPLGALQRDPVGTVSALLPAKTIIGGAGGKVAAAGLLGKSAKVFATAERQPLVLPKARLSSDPLERPQVIPALSQPPLRANLIDRAIQVGIEKATTSSADLSRRRIRNLSSKHEAEARFAGYQQRDEIMQKMLGAKRKLSKEERKATTAIIQGITPRQMADYYAIRAVEDPKSPHLKAQADFWGKVAVKVPNLNERLTTYLNAVEPSLRAREASLQRVTSIDQATLQAREGITRDEVLAKLQAHASPSAADTTGRDPLYFPHIADRPNFGGFLFRRGMNPTRRVASEVKNKNELVLFRSGRWQPDSRHLESRIASAPLAEASLEHLQGQIHEFGRVPASGSTYDPKHATLVRVHPKGAKVEPIDTSGAGLAQQIRDVRAQSSGDKDFLSRLESQIVVHTPDGVVPAEPGLILVPNEVLDQVRGTLRSMNRGGFLRGLQSATDAWRYMTLMLRGGYLTNNVVGNTLQGAIGGMGPVSIARALKYGDAVPKKLIGSGTIADMSRVQRLGGNADSPIGRAVNLLADSSLGRGTGFAIAHNPIMRGNIWYENTLRKALYLHAAIPAAKKATSGSRFSRNSNTVMDHLRNNEMPQATQLVVDMFGDMRKKNKSNLRLAIPFYRWIGFITKLSLATLPAKMPIRNELLQSLGRLGNDELGKMGLLPTWMQGAIPSNEHTQNIDGTPHQMATMTLTQGLNPFASIAQTLTSDTSGMPTATGILNTLNPVASAAGSVAVGRDLGTGFDLRDASGAPISATNRDLFDPTLWKTLINQELRTVPFVNLLDQPSYKSADALPFTGTKKYPRGLRQPDQETQQRVIGYLTGINQRPVDVTLYNLQNAYKLLDPKAHPEFDADMLKQIRHRINILTGDAKKKGLQVTVPVLKAKPLTVAPLKVKKLVVGNNAP